MPTTNLAHERFVAAMKEGKGRIRAGRAAYPRRKGCQYDNRLKQIGAQTQYRQELHYPAITGIVTNQSNQLNQFNLRFRQQNRHQTTTKSPLQQQTSFSARTPAGIGIQPKMPHNTGGVLTMMPQKINKNQQQI